MRGAVAWLFAPHGRKWLLLEPIDLKTPWGEVRVPAGFVCDGASIPQLARSLCPSDAFTLRAAIVHDWLYRVVRWARDICDLIFRYVLALDACPILPACWMHAAVRVGGRRAYANPKPAYIMEVEPCE